MGTHHLIYDGDHWLCRRACSGAGSLLQYVPPWTLNRIDKKCTAFSMESTVHCDRRNGRHCAQYTFFLRSSILSRVSIDGRVNFACNTFSSQVKPVCCLLVFYCNVSCKSAFLLASARPTPLSLDPSRSSCSPTETCVLLARTNLSLFFSSHISSTNQAKGTKAVVRNTLLFCCHKIRLCCLLSTPGDGKGPLQPRGPCAFPTRLGGTAVGCHGSAGCVGISHPILSTGALIRMRA